nr:retrovirus-related Pol polyprotein from transposon TNT 1-94 [Tanacetum cinerariifolium]
MVFSAYEECLTSGSEDEEYVMAVRDFKKFFKRRECLKPPKNKNQRAFVGGSWSDNGKEDDEKVKDETCLVAHASSEACFESSYFSDENSSIDDLALDNEYEKLCEMSLKIITKNKRVDLEPDEWIKDSGCSKHMTSNQNLFSTYKAYNGGNIIFGSNLHGNIIGKDEEEAIKVIEKKNLENDIVDETLEIDEIVNIKESRNHPLENVIGNLNQRTLRLQIKQMEDGIFFNQSKYIKEMLKKFGLEDSKPMKTPKSSNTKLTKDKECKSLDSTKYRGMIGSLLYLTTSRLDIMFSVCLCARFQEAPKASHLEAVKRIFQYIKGTTHLELWYPKGTSIETVVYIDSDHAEDYVDRKRTSSICTFVGYCLTSWFSKKQTTLAISATEAEYVSTGKACQQALWMKQALIDYDVRLDDVSIMCDNKGAIDLRKNTVQHSRTKHIEIRHHFLGDNVQRGHILIEKVPSVENIADLLTKPLKRESFNYLCLGLGMMEHIP